jgi:heme-degrading monooxygenase HmoA
MVLEVAMLDVRPGRSQAFEAAFRWWDSLESHTEGFRGSPGYQRWRALLHSFYDPFPTVEHYVVVRGV